MALNAGFLNLFKRVAARDRGVTLRALYSYHHVRLLLLLTQRFSPDEFHLILMTVRASRFRLMVAAQTLHPRLVNLSMFLPCRVADIAVQDSGDMLLMGEGKVVNSNLGPFKSLMTLAALGVRDLGRLWQRDGPFGMTFRAGGFFSGVAFKAGLLRGSKGGWIVGVVIDIVVAGGAGVVQFLNVEPMGDGNIIGVDSRRSFFYFKNTGVATDAVWVDLVKLGRETGMFSIALKGEDVDAWHQGMACCVTFRTVDLGMQIRLFPEGGFSLLMMAGDAEFFLRCRIGGQGHCGIEAHDRQNAPEDPGPERKMGKMRQMRQFEIQPIPPLLAGCNSDLSHLFYFDYRIHPSLPPS